MKGLRPMFAIFLSTVLLYLPVFSNSQLFLARGNDLQEFFWPIVLYIKQHLIIFHELPLWYSSILSGAPLLPDPQSQLFYLPNILFLALPVGAGFMLSMFLHSFMSGIGMYLVAHGGFRFKNIPSTFAGVLYVSSPIIAGYIEAGHFGLVLAWAWIPFALLATLKIAKTPNVLWSSLLSVSLAALFFTHVLTAALAAISLSILLIVLILPKQVSWKKPIAYFFLGALLSIGLTAPVLLPQIEWSPQTTRSLLVTNPDVYPKWLSKIEYVKAVVAPWTGGIESMWTLNTAKWIPLGFFSIVLATIGFFNTSKKTRLLLLSISFFILAVSLNNASPFIAVLAKVDAYSVLRVATRTWFLPVVTICLLGSYALNTLLNKGLHKKVLLLLAVAAIVEPIVLSWGYMAKPVAKRTFASEEVVSYLAKDNDTFRVFCLDRCISQLDAVQNNLELIEGYSTLQQLNYYQRAWELTGYYWDYYSLSLPPFGAYRFDDLKPNYQALGEQNTKYIVSAKKIDDNDLRLAKEFDDYNVYVNLHFQPRSNVQISSIRPGHIKLINNDRLAEVKVSEVYSSGWKAFSGGQELEIAESHESLLKIDSSEAGEEITLEYLPQSFKVGVLLSIGAIATIFLLATYQMHQTRRRS